METRDASGLARRLGLFDGAMLVMGGIVGSGIFINPYVAANKVHTPLLILGGLDAGRSALPGAFVYAELAARRSMARFRCKRECTIETIAANRSRLSLHYA